MMSVIDIVSLQAFFSIHMFFPFHPPSCSHVCRFRIYEAPDFHNPSKARGCITIPYPAPNTLQVHQVSPITSRKVTHARHRRNIPNKFLISGSHKRVFFRLLLWFPMNKNLYDLTNKDVGYSFIPPYLRSI